MPYPGGRKQIIAIYLSIKREKGEEEAQAFLRRHRRELKQEARRRAKKK